eukprot:11560439-Alexandrium_andersonii.AAC.1
MWADSGRAGLPELFSRSAEARRQQATVSASLFESSLQAAWMWRADVGLDCESGRLRGRLPKAGRQSACSLSLTPVAGE